MPERNRAEWATGVRRSATGRPFQAFGSATEKARRCRITVRERGTRNSACAEERNEIRRNVMKLFVENKTQYKYYLIHCLKNYFFPLVSIFPYFFHLSSRDVLVCAHARMTFHCHIRTTITI